MLQLCDLPEVIAVNRECYSHGKHGWFTEEGPENHFPVLEPFLSQDAKTDICPKKGENILKINGHIELGLSIFL